MGEKYLLFKLLLNVCFGLYVFVIAILSRVYGMFPSPKFMLPFYCDIYDGRKGMVLSYFHILISIFKG
ncbi:hypothetical protein HORM4_950085 [Vibrio harveyi]|nr:hypothetical protein HORM4_950085 [Vibrio harveyi]